MCVGVRERRLNIELACSGALHPTSEAYQCAAFLAFLLILWKILFQKRRRWLATCSPSDSRDSSERLHEGGGSKYHSGELVNPRPHPLPSPALCSPFFFTPTNTTSTTCPHVSPPCFGSTHARTSAAVGPRAVSRFALRTAAWMGRRA